MPAYQRTYPNTNTRAKATRIICSWCKKLELVAEKWVKVSPIAEEEKTGYRCCPACDTKKRGERLVNPPPLPYVDKPKVMAMEAKRPPVLPASRA